MESIEGSPPPTMGKVSTCLYANSDVGKMLRFEANGRERILETFLVQKVISLKLGTGPMGRKSYYTGVLRNG